MLRQGGRRLVLATLALAVLNSVYNTLYLVGVKTFDIASGVFTFSMTVVMLPVVMISMRRRVEAATWVSVVLVTPGIVLALGPLVRMSDAGGGAD